MLPTIGWLAFAVGAGAAVGAALGHWPAVAGLLRRWVEDPAAGPTTATPPRTDQRPRRTS